MANEKEISSTEKLLNVIRGSGDAGESLQTESSPAAAASQQVKKRWLYFPSREFIGVEIFRDRLNIVRAGRGKRGWQVLDAASVSLPGGITLEHSDFPFFLKTHLENVLQSRRTDIWVCLPPSRGEVWTVQVPKLKKGLTNAVYWSARKEKTFNEAEYFFDYRIKDEILDQGTKKLVAEVCIASSREIRQYRKIFSEIGHPLTGVTLPAFSLENLFIHKWIDPGDDPYAVLYIGEDASYIDIHGRQTSLFNRVIKTGRDSILDSLIMGYSRHGMEEENLELQGEHPEGADETQAALRRQQAAQRLKQEASRNQKQEERMVSADPNATESYQQLFGMLRPALERLARQMERTIDHSVNVLNHPAPARIYICGAISFLPGLAGFFSEQLGIPAVIMDSLVPLSESPSEAVPLPEGEERLSLVSTAALAMPSEKTINFLHTAADMDKEREALRNTNVVAAACALLFILTGAWWWTARYELRQAQHQTAQVRQELDQYSPKLQTEDLARLAGDLEKKKKQLKRYSRRLQPVAVLKALNQLTPEPVKLLHVRMVSGSDGTGTDGKSKAGGSLTVEGFVQSAPSLFETHLTGYLLKLRRSVIFKRSTIAKSTPDTLSTGEEVYRFTLTIDLRQA